MKNIGIKIVAWAFLAIGLIVGLSIISSIFFVPVLIPEAKLIKLFLLDSILFIVGCFAILVGFGLFEFLLSLIKIEEELEEIEEGIKEKQ